MKSRRLLLLALPLLLSACFERTHPTADASVRPVEVVRVALSQDSDAPEYAGTIRPRHEADIAFRASGRILARLADVGDRVTGGQELARLDPVDLELALRSADADLRSAEAQERQATADAVRSHSLVGQGWVAEAADEVKQAAARSAQEHVIAARAAYELAHNRLDYAVLRAPQAGVVTSVIADPGTVVSEGQPVFRLADVGALEAEVALPEAAVADALAAQKHGTPAQVTLWAQPAKPLLATLREMSPSADPKLRTYTARYTLQNAPDWVAMGMSVNLRLAHPGAAELAALPAAAVADRGQGPMVWVVDPDRGALTARRVDVRALRQDHTLVAGLHAGELVVALGVQKLDPTARVRVADIRPMQE